MSDVDLRLGNWMAERREERGLSQEALALQLGRDQPTLSKIERGLRRTSAADLLEWAAALDVPQEEVCAELVRLRNEFFGYKLGLGTRSE